MMQQTSPWQHVRADRIHSYGAGMKPIAVQHVEGGQFPVLPVFNSGPETNRYAGHAKVDIRQLC
jgi:hypothetical protein